MSKTKKDIEAKIKPTKIDEGYLPRRYLPPPLEADSVHVDSAAATYSPNLARLCEKRAALGICGLRRRSNIHDEIDTTRKSAVSVYIHLLVFGFRRWQ